MISVYVMSYKNGFAYLMGDAINAQFNISCNYEL